MPNNELQYNFYIKSNMKRNVILILTSLDCSKQSI